MNLCKVCNEPIYSSRRTKHVYDCKKVTKSKQKKQEPEFVSPDEPTWLDWAHSVGLESIVSEELMQSKLAEEIAKLDFTVEEIAKLDFTVGSELYLLCQEEANEERDEKSRLAQQKWKRKRKQKQEEETYGKCDVCFEVVYSKLRSRHPHCDESKRKQEEAHIKSFKSRYKTVLQVVSRSTKTWELTYDKWLKLILSPCEYCKFPNDSKQIGLDRLDNAVRVYRDDNVVSVCNVCQYARNWNLDYDNMKTFVGPSIRALKIEALKKIDYAAGMRMEMQDEIDEDLRFLAKQKQREIIYKNKQKHYDRESLDKQEKLDRKLKKKQRIDARLILEGKHCLFCKGSGIENGQPCSMCEMVKKMDSTDKDYFKRSLDYAQSQAHLADYSTCDICLETVYSRRRKRHPHCS
jgi:hypothetical protein